MDMRRPKTPITVTRPDTTPFVVDADGRRFLERVGRFLVQIQHPTLMARALNEGYSTREHGVVWALFTEAAGGATSVELNAASGALQLADAQANAARAHRLKQLDTFENTWFPRTRAMIRRVVTDGTAELYTAAFFADIEQQPLGPNVVGSVSCYLMRVASLDTTPGSTGAQVRELLRERGLTDERIASAVALVNEAKSFDLSFLPTTGPSAAEVAASSARRAEALTRLARWYDDWATTFRSVFNAREQLKLGLTHAKGRASRKTKTAAPGGRTDPAQPT
jgi:hypothetical protein